MGQVPHYVQWGLLQISVPNLIVIAPMIGVFALVLLLPWIPGLNRLPRYRPIWRDHYRQRTSGSGPRRGVAVSAGKPR